MKSPVYKLLENILGLSSHNNYLLNLLGSGTCSAALTRSTIPVNSCAGDSSFTLNKVDFAFSTQSYFATSAFKESSLERKASRIKRFARFR